MLKIVYNSGVACLTGDMHHYHNYQAVACDWLGGEQGSGGIAPRLHDIAKLWVTNIDGSSTPTVPTHSPYIPHPVAASSWATPTTMSLPRTSRALARSYAFAASRIAPSLFAPRPCPQCSRAFSSSTSHRQSSKRQMQTATAYQPSSLQPPPPPPRNFGVPETSIAGGASEVKSWTPSRLVPEQRSQATQQERSSVSLPESEAQKTQAAPIKSARPRRYNFGPRKATIKISQSAVEHLRDLLDQPEPKLIRIGTKAKGCSGLAYHLEYVDKPSKLDEVVEQDGVKVLIDNKALLNIIGSEMDWLDDKLNERFIFKNPNISKFLSSTMYPMDEANNSIAEQCGCGESFSVS